MDDTREELMRLTQLLVVEGTKIVAAFAARHGLHPTDIEALTRVMVADQRGTPMTAGALADELGLTSGSITALVGRLERAGHMSRARDQTDGRKVLLHYSRRGRMLADMFFAPVHRLSHATMDQFTPDELKTIRRYLEMTSTAMADYRQSLDSRPSTLTPAPPRRTSGGWEQAGRVESQSP